MAKENAKYKCNICGNVVQVLEAGAWELSCCEVAMEEIKD